MLKVIIADDAAPMRNRLKAELSRYPGGYELLAECEGGLEAVEKTLSLNPDITFLDVVMGDIGGVGAAIKLREAGCEFLLVTSSGQGSVLSGFDEGQWIIKPYALSLLYRKIAAIVAK